jgi:hypothetical protein
MRAATRCGRQGDDAGKDSATFGEITDADLDTLFGE